MTSTDTVRTLSEWLGYSLLPLHSALQDSASARDFLADFGWEFEDPPASFLALQQPVALAVEAATGIANDTDVDLEIALSSLVSAFSAISALEAASDTPADFRAEFPAALRDYLIATELLDNAPVWGALFRALRIIAVEDVEAAGARPAFTRYTVDRDRLVQYLRQPLATLRDAYGWGGSSLEGDYLLESFAGLARALGADTCEHVPPLSLLNALTSGALDPAETDQSGPCAVLFRSPEPDAFYLGVALFLVPETLDSVPGVAVFPAVVGDLDPEMIVLPDRELTFDGDLVAGLAAILRPDEPVAAVGASGFEIAFQTVPSEPVLLLSDSHGTRLEVRSARTGCVVGRD